MGSNKEYTKEKEYMEVKIREIFDRIGEIKKSVPEFPTTYTDLGGRTYNECPGAYNDYMVRAMASDMLHYWVMFKVKSSKENSENSPKNCSAILWEASKLMESAMPKMKTLNYELLRMMDDLKGDRPVKPWQFKKVESFIRLLTDATEKVNDSGMDDDAKEKFHDRCKSWVVRLCYMNIWAFYLRQNYEMNYILMEAQMQEADSDGNLICGLAENEIEFVKLLISLRRTLLHLVLQVPVMSEDSDYIMDKLEVLEIMTEAIVRNCNE